MNGRDKKGKFSKGCSGNPGGRPKGTTWLCKIIDDLKVDSMQETEVRERFRILNELYGWFKIIHSQEGYPDFVLSNEKGDVIRAEVEVNSKTFLAHQHDINGCDLIICWKHNWVDCEIPVLTMAFEWKNYIEMRKVRPYKMGILPSEQES